MSNSLFKPFSEQERPFSPSARAYTGVPSRQLPPPRQMPNQNPVGAGVRLIEKGLKSLNEFAEARREAEISRIKEQAESQLPEGAKADLFVSDYHFGEGFQNMGVSKQGSQYLKAPNKLPILRSDVVPVTGKGKTASTPQSITVTKESGETQELPIDPRLRVPARPSPTSTQPHHSPERSSTRSVDDRPSLSDRLNRGEHVRVDSLDRRSRDYLDGRIVA